MFSDPSQAINRKAMRKLNKERIRLIITTLLRLPAQIVTKLVDKRNKKIKHYTLLIIGIPFYIFSRPLDKYLKRKAREEWNTKKYERNGSEMCLYFKRDA